MSAPRLHIITHEFYPRRGGIATFTEEMAAAAAAAGAEVEVWAQAAPAGTAEKNRPFLLRRLPLKGTHDFWCLFRLGRELVRNRRDLRQTIVWLPEPGPMLSLMYLQFFKAFRPPCLILTFHGSEILRFHRNPLTRRLARRLIRHATRISTLTGYTRDLLTAHFPEAAGKTVLSPGALRTDFRLPPRPAADPVPADGRLTVLTVGRWHPRKGQLETLQALLALPPELRARITCRFVGGHGRRGYEAKLRALAAGADFPVRFDANADDHELAAAYAQADIFAMTSVPCGPSVEGFGLVYLEASAHGLPVVAHDIGGVGEAVLNGRTGLLVRPDDPAGLTAAFARLITEPALRRQLGEAGREWARRNCWQESARSLFDLPAAR
ncbi:MAG: glycosyltransferase family 4 protein [Opitutaceae bacterium]|nr:glycosyltransferase family 4 protein [Opitutaceae bacterium]